MATATIVRIAGDTLKPLCFRCFDEDDNPLPLSGMTVKIELLNDSDKTVALAATSTGITAEPTQGVTFDGTSGLAICVGHGIQEGEQVTIATSGSLSGTALVVGVPYFAIKVGANTFGLAATSEGANLIAGAGTGNHTASIVGSVQYKPSSGLAPGIYNAFLTITDGSGNMLTLPSADETDTVQGCVVRIHAIGT